jgi:hypothetical protein
VRRGIVLKMIERRPPVVVQSEDFSICDGLTWKTAQCTGDRPVAVPSERLDAS